MKSSVILSALGAAALSAAHGIVQELTIDGADFSGYLPYQDPYASPVPERIVWAFPTAGNGPVEDVTTSDITCNKAATAAQLTAPATAGSQITFFWTTWPESHKGPTMTYLANCGGDCTTVDPTTLDYFKIDEAGLNSDGTWASDDVIANNNTWTVTIPSDIAPGSYIVRHELLALHSAGTSGGAQFYPMCANLVITGSGSAVPTDTVKFPGGYAAADPGILVNIYGTLTSYTIPGPAVYGSSGSSTPTKAATTTAAAATSAAATSVAEAETTSAAVEVPTTSAVAEEPTTSAVAEEPTTSVVAEEPTTSAVVEEPTTSAVAEVPTTSSAAVAVPTTSKAAAVPTTTAIPTTLVTKTRPATTAAAATSAAASTGCSKTSEEYNKCLDAVNSCIRNAQSKTGGAVDFSSCDAQRSACKVC